ncbi:MAG: SpoIID/LytB domain-containing protein, partial [Clostridia bacterium]|nr:SpoIID/LytB domain-containing protein [Clostridia bacterium]
EVRVGINFSSSALEDATVSCGDDVLNISISGYDEPFSVSLNMLKLSVSDGTLYAKTIFGGDIAYAESGRSMTISPENSSSGLILNGTHYYGSLEFYANSDGKITAINVLNIDEYIKGVLPSEIYPSWDMEALKAAAVVSRTYALKNAMASSHSSAGFDVCNNTHCQMYEGTKKENANTNKAIEDTAGIVVMYNGALATTPYHSSTGGYTASAAEVWGGKPENYPYLTNVMNPYEDYRNVPNGKWLSVVEPSQLSSYISATYLSKLPGGNLSFNYDKTKNGYISHMTVSDEAGNTVSLNTADKVRSFFGRLVKSANFGIAKTYIPSSTYSTGVTVLSAEGEYDLTGLSQYEYITSDGIKTATSFTEVLVFDGKGYGHGVGMSQFGARDMANAGFTYEEILATYYPGTELVNINHQ